MLTYAPGNFDIPKLKVKVTSQKTILCPASMLHEYISIFSLLWSVVFRRPSSCVVRSLSTFDVYTPETTFVIGFSWNLVRMFVLTISRPSSNMGHVGSKTRSPGQILGNSCLHPRGHICNLILMNFVIMFVLTISRSSLNMGHVGLKTRSPGQILGNSCLHSRGYICFPILMKLCQNVCFDNI